MPNQKPSTKKKKAAGRAPARIENPSWLRQEPIGSAPNPPIQPRADLLPFTGLSWENFERLCVRLADIDATVETVWAYGKSGHAQHGIDALVRLTDGSYHVWQSKRHKTISKAKIKAAIDFFLKRKWAHQATRFVLAVACELSAPPVVEAIEAARDRLRERNIEFEALGPTRLTQLLTTEPELVDDFFGRPWVAAVCPPEAMDRLRQRLSRFDAATLRTGLRTYYNSWIATVDPGLPIVGVDAQGRTRASIPLPDRYIRPDLLVQSAETEVAPSSDEATAKAQSRREAETGEREPAMATGPTGSARAVLRERRVVLDGFLSTQRLSLILGDAGSGKSSLLRFLALDILSDQPELVVTQEQYKGLIPVWLPFAFWVRMSADQRTPAAIEDAAAAFLQAQGGQELAEHIRQAVAGKRVVILVDGIDEASDPSTAQTLLAILTTFVDRAGIPVIATSRPHGARSLTILGGAWGRSTLAPLSDSQRHALATLWFSVLERFESDATVPDAQIRTRARRKADAFLPALQANAGIARLSQTALFLLAFISLHSRGQELPRNRFVASKEIVDQLMEHQPSRRAVSALATDAAQAEPRLRDRIICDFAFSLQAGELAGAIPDAAPEDGAIARASSIILRRQNTGNQDAAETSARAIFSFTEERAGLLVNKAPGNIGFLHLSLQEFLAARHLLQFTTQERLAFVTANAVVLRWREPILYLLAMTQTEAETGQLIGAIESAQPRGLAERAARDALLTDAVFSDFSHDLDVVRRIAGNFLSEAESTAWGARQTHILMAAVEGLFSESVSNLCREKLAQWIPDRHGYSREAALDAMPGWNAASREEAIPAIWRCLRAENEHIWRKAAQVLPVITEGNVDTKAQLLRLARRAPSVQTARAAICSVGHGWANDEDVGEIARRLRSSSLSGVCLDAIRIRAHRGDTNAEDLDRFFAITYERERYSDRASARGLIDHFAHHHCDAFKQKLETALLQERGRPHETRLLAGALFVCDSESASARRALSQILDHDWMLADLFAREGFPIDRVSWTPELIAKVEELIQDRTKYGDHDLYWVAKTLQLPSLRQRFLDGLKADEHFGFWYSRGLAETWKNDPEVQEFFASMLDASPEMLSHVGEELPLMVDDRTACRAALLRGMRADVSRYDFLLKGCKNLGLTAADDEMVQAALAAGERRRAPLYRDLWASNIILTFPEHPQVRVLAEEELLRRDGSFRAVAQSYPNDPDMCRRILGVVCPVDEGPRMVLVRALESAAPSNSAGYDLLMNARRDTDGIVCAESIMGSVEAILTRGSLPEHELRWLVDELDTVGPEYEKRRTAAVVGLLLSGNIERFANAREPGERSLRIPANPDLTKEDIYLHRLLPRWAEVSEALGGEAAAMERLQITPERTLGSLHAGIPEAKHLFDLLMAKVPTAQHLQKKDVIAALAEFSPRGPEMCQQLEAMLNDFGPNRTIGDLTAILLAGQIFADQFRNDREMRGRVLDAFNANPGNIFAAGALAELLLREDDPNLADAVLQGVRLHPYDVCTNYKLMAVFASEEEIVRSVADLLGKDMEPDSWAIPYWVPTLVRRIATDTGLQTRMRAAARDASAPSVKISFWSLLRRATGGSDDLRREAAEELRKLEGELEPVMGYDLLTNSHRLLFHVLTELAL